ncbi:MAG TPA: hypothetical protein VKR81_07555, partial [Candidatus Binatia bacterium]|nr:hypothetical protein [Candidatus Binatia bacterium]
LTLSLPSPRGTAVPTTLKSAIAFHPLSLVKLPRCFRSRNSIYADDAECLAISTAAIRRQDRSGVLRFTSRRAFATLAL